MKKAAGLLVKSGALVRRGASTRILYSNPGSAQAVLHAWTMRNGPVSICGCITRRVMQGVVRQSFYFGVFDCRCCGSMVLFF